MREKLRDMYKSDKKIRTGEVLVEFMGTIGGKNARFGDSGCLILDVCLRDGTPVTDHIWLGNAFYGYCKDNMYQCLRSYKKNNLKGKRIRFTARIMPYDNGHSEFGLLLTKNSDIFIDGVNQP